MITKPEAVSVLKNLGDIVVETVNGSETWAARAASCTPRS